jgi:hypothetical protein
LVKLRRITAIINAKAVIIAGIAVVSMLLCRRYGLAADFPLALIATAIVFPIVFSIGGAYKRREAALGHYANIKAHGRAIYLAARDWLEEADAGLEADIKQTLGDLLGSARDLFGAPVAEMAEQEQAVYRRFSVLSLHIKAFRGKNMAANEVSRCNQYLSKMIVSFENMKHIYQYRTPITLRAYSDFFILLMAVFYGPYFAEIGKNYTSGLEYLMPVFFCIILVGLDNIQDQLENPFDQIGEDDIAINAEKFVALLDS